MSADVRTLRGDPIAAPGTPDLKYVEFLKKVLARAEAGETTGCFLIEACHDGMYHRDLIGNYRPIVMLGCVELLKRDVGTD